MTGWFGTLIGAALLAGGITAGNSQAAPSGKAGYDGLWSVLIITESGECDRAYRYAMRIAKGDVRYQGDPGGIDIDISGRIDDRGHVNVTVSRGQQFANGTGRLATDRGAGTWKGKSSTAECSGRWEAERRGT